MKTRPHPVHFAGAAWWVAFVALVATLLIRHNDLSVAAELKVVVGALAAAATGIVGPLWRWLRTRIEIDGNLLRWEAGALRASLVEIDLTRARQVAVDETYAGRLLGYGTSRVIDERGTTYVLPPLGLDAIEAIVARWGERPTSRRARRDG